MKGLSASLHPPFEAIKRVNKQTLQQLQTNPNTRVGDELARQIHQAIKYVSKNIQTKGKVSKQQDLNSCTRRGRAETPLGLT